MASSVGVPPAGTGCKWFDPMGQIFTSIWRNGGIALPFQQRWKERSLADSRLSRMAKAYREIRQI